MELVQLKSGVFMVVIFLVVSLLGSGVQARARRNPACKEDQQQKMTEEFTKCLEKYTKEHHEASGKATSPEEYQKYTCKLLSDTVECGELWKRCHAPEEVRSIQDMHIQARITQFRDNRDGIDVFKCPVVAEYIESGRADRVDQSTEGGCSVSEVSEVQGEFQECSHNKSLALYNEIQNLQEGRFSRDTNDLEAELRREDDEEEASLDPLKDVKPRLCNALKAIAKDCIESFNKCFSREDAEQIKSQHIEQMQKYYAKIYKGVGDLDDCPQLQLIKKAIHEEYEDDELYDEEYDYNEEEEYYSSSSTSTTSRTSTTSKGTSTTTPDTDEFHGMVTPSYTPDPEGNAVIAEPPASHFEAASSAMKQVMSLSVVIVLCYLQSLF